MFFKDFIISAENHIIFIEQLKITLANELFDMNNSTYETLNLSTVVENVNNDDDDGGAINREYVVRPETLSTLSVLAKFLGFVVAKPFQYEYGRNGVVDNRQIQIRNKVRILSLSSICLDYINCRAKRKPIVIQFQS